jgi:hypothetical protein
MGDNVIRKSLVDHYWDMVNELWATAVGGPASPDDLEIDFLEDEKGNVHGWEIKVKNRIRFLGGDFVDCCSELFRIPDEGDYLRNLKHSYHFQPDDLTARYVFRIDKNKTQGLHANPDKRLCKGRKPKLDKHIDPSALKINIRDFSLLCFLLTAVLYRQGKRYPLLPDTDDVYNSAIDASRKQVQ